VPAVWTVDLTQELSDSQLAWLSAEERARAERFRVPGLAPRWRVAHVALRAVLAERLGCDPAAVRFGAEANGKPFLVPAPGASATHAPCFNLSHAGDRALIAVGGELPLGVDVELMKPVPEMVGVAEDHFAPEERTALFAEPEPSRLATFYRIWTRKEAFVKATGIGVGPALQRFAVTAAVDAAKLLRVDASVADGARWRLLDLPLDGSYVAALVLRAEDTSPVTLRSWTALRGG
jgi:4'-phosphopantetheinyl transferase